MGSKFEDHATKKKSEKISNIFKRLKNRDDAIIARIWRFSAQIDFVAIYVLKASDKRKNE